MLKPLRKWRVALSILTAVVVAAPFLIRHRSSYYTDGENFRSPKASAQKVLRKILWEPPRALDREVNDPVRDDYEPTESPFGDLLVFTRGRPGENADLWSSSRVRGRWTRPLPVHGINTEADELGATFSADGEWLYFYSDRPGGFGGYDIWASRRLSPPSGSETRGESRTAPDHRASGGWTEPINLGAAINTPWNEMSPALDTRRDVLYFTSDRRRGEENVAPWRATVRARLHAADYDIYVARRAGEVAINFSPATPLATVNRSPWAEGAVAVSPAGDFLYFSSNRPGGEGGFDLYRVRLSGREPAIPETLGPTVNTAGDELDPALASRGFELYFSRSREGQEDLFVTVSREVYADAQVGPPYWSLAAIFEFLRDLLRHIPPSILLILAFVLLALFVILLLRAFGRERLGTLNVLTRCFLLALFLHLLLAIWMNRNEVERLVLEVFDTEESFDAFEVSVGGLPEENVALAIREALARTETDEAPALAARMRTTSLSPASTIAGEHPSLPGRLETSPPEASIPSFELQPIREPSRSLDLRDDTVTVGATLPEPPLSVEPLRPELVSRGMKTPVAETGRPVEELVRPMVSPRTDRDAPANSPPLRSLSAPPPRDLPEELSPSGREADHFLGRIGVPRPLPAPSPGDSRPLPAVARDLRRPPPPPLGQRVVASKTPPSPRMETEEQKVELTRSPRREMRIAPVKSRSFVVGRSAPVRRDLPEQRPHRAENDDLATRLQALPGSKSRRAVGGVAVGKVTAAGALESSSSFAPRIYRLREKSRRQEVLVESGGSDATETAVRAGLAWLALHQSPDGRWTLNDYADHLENPSVRDVRHRSWDGKRTRDSRGGSDRAKGGDTAATGLALLAFLGHGDTHLEGGEYRETTERGLRWLLAAQRSNGDLRGAGNLYMHAIAAFALCEAYAFTRDPRLREPAQKAIDFTVRTQNPQKGGWRYDPYPGSTDVDTSVFGWMLMALKSGRLGALDVDERALVRAAGYLDSVRMTRRGGRYAYQPGKSRTSLAMTAQGFFSHQMLIDSLLKEEQKGDAELRRADDESISYLLANLPRAADMEGVNFYYWYYATLALFQEGGKAWEIWNASLSDLLVKLQVGKEHGTAHGSWDPRGKRAETGGRVYSTALSILCLEVYYRYARLNAR